MQRKSANGEGEAAAVIDLRCGGAWDRGPGRPSASSHPDLMAGCGDVSHGHRRSIAHLMEPTMRAGMETGFQPRATVRRRLPRRHCPSLLAVAHFESGLTGPVEAAALQAHARRCPRCHSALADIRQARRELLPPGSPPPLRQLEQALARALADEAHRLH